MQYGSYEPQRAISVKHNENFSPSTPRALCTRSAANHAGGFCTGQHRGGHFQDNKVLSQRAGLEDAERGGLPLIPSLPRVPQKPTTGLLAITLALHLCDVVHIAGFGYPDAHNRKQTIHYYEQITLKSMAVSGSFLHVGGADHPGTLGE